MSSFPHAPVFAAVLAAGTGARMGGGTPKQFVQLAGLPVLAHSLLAFERFAAVDGIVLVSHPDHEAATARVAREAGISKLIAVAPGGATRGDSSRAAIDALPEGDGLILVHDAARPLVEDATIDAVVAALVDHRAAAPALPVADTIVEAHDGHVTAMPKRSSLRQMQTPQGFEIATLREAYRLAAQDPGFVASDDCGVVHRYLPDVAIKLVAGSERNLKLTYPQDLRLAELVLEQPQS